MDLPLQHGNLAWHWWKKIVFNPESNWTSLQKNIKKTPDCIRGFFFGRLMMIYLGYFNSLISNLCADIEKNEKKTFFMDKIGKNNK
tara:strand:- start:374 stop:631 length:258 start_codon:yes stop_codon:yes gene_type:complete